MLNHTCILTLLHLLHRSHEGSAPNFYPQLTVWLSLQSPATRLHLSPMAPFTVRVCLRVLTVFIMYARRQHRQYINETANEINHCHLPAMSVYTVTHILQLLPTLCNEKLNFLPHITSFCPVEESLLSSLYTS